MTAWISRSDLFFIHRIVQHLFNTSPVLPPGILKTLFHFLYLLCSIDHCLITLFSTWMEDTNIMSWLSQARILFGRLAVVLYCLEYRINRKGRMYRR